MQQNAEGGARLLKVRERVPVRIEALSGMSGPAILLPAAASVGLAAFRSGDEVVVVLDAPLEYQPSTLDPPFAHLTSQRTTDATIIRIPVPASGNILVDRSGQGWAVVAGPTRNEIHAIVPLPVEIRPGVIGRRLAVSGPGRVVSINNPQGSGLLLVGTQGVAGEAVLEPVQHGRYHLMATIQGVVASPNTDDVSLGREANAFVLTAGPRSGDTITPDSSHAASANGSLPDPVRLFGFPNDSIPMLVKTLDEQIREAAAAPALARTMLRLKIAETMIALGLGVEAQSTLEVAAAADPSMMGMPRAIALRAVAAIVAGRAEAASGIMDPKLGSTAEVTLWRSLLQVARDQASSEDAAKLGGTIPLLVNYPPTLRLRLLPAALEAMALNGQAAAANNIMDTMPSQRNLEFARGLVLEALGKPTHALAAYDQLALSRNRHSAYAAQIRAVELRIGSGTLDASKGADALDRLLFGWREAREELSLRIRIAALRRQAGQWQEALTVLQDGLIAYPDSRAQIDPELAETLTQLFSGDAGQALPASDLVALYDKNVDFVRSMSWPLATGLKLVDRLSDLGLQNRAEPVLASLAATASDPALRPFLGARLAALRLDINDPTGAISALAESAPPLAATIEPTTAQARQMLYARAESERGNKDAALAMFQALGTAEADEARADIYTARKDWKQAVSALAAVEQNRLPKSGILNADQQAIVMRLAEAATLGGDAGTLKRVTDTYGKVMRSGSFADLFRIITSPPVHNSNDLPRALEEIQLARSVSLQTVSPGHH